MKRLIVLLATMLLSFGLAFGANTVDITMGSVGGADTDTLRAGTDSYFELVLENDFKLFGISMGFEVSSPDGASWSWTDMPGGFGLAAPKFVTVNAGSRMDPASAVFDMTAGLLITQTDIDGTSPDMYLIGGVSLFGGLEVGGPQAMVKSHFVPAGPAGEADVMTMCIDSVFVPPSGAFVFTNEGGSNTAPTTLWMTGGVCWPLTLPRNFCPEFTAASASMSVDHCGNGSVAFSATDPEDDAIQFALAGNTGDGVAIVTDNGNGTGSVAYTASANDVGASVVLTVEAFDAFHGTGECVGVFTVNVTVTNNAPTINCGAAYNPVGFDNTITKTIVGADVDACDGLAYAVVSGPGAIDGAGVYTWATTIADIGLHTVVVSVTDGLSNPVECSFEVDVLLTEPYEIVIEKLHDVYQGHYVDLPIWLTKGSEAMGGFDFLLAYDNSLLTFTEASMGTYFQGCGWEYFTYRHGSHGNCGNACPSGEIRLVGMAETNNGPVHPDFECIKNGKGEIIANLTFFVTTDVNANDQFAQVKFFWMDCGDNTISVASGDTLAISRFVYFYYGTGGMDSYIDVTDNTWGFPGVYGAPDACLAMFDGQHDKLPPIRFIDFFDGGIDIIDKDEIDDRGDINMNGIANEIADAVMFTNYFITGLSAFGSHVDGSIAASDVNADGTALTVADLVYLVRVIIGDALPYPKPIPDATFEASAQMVNGNLNVNVNTDVDAGAALFVFNVNGEAGNPVVHNSMDVVSSFENGELRVLVYNIGREVISSGELLTIPVNGSAELASVEAADYNGAMMEGSIRNLPSSFQVKQNYPNPFNPETTMAFDLSVASNWTVDIYNIAGQKVNSFSGFAEAGTMNVTWDGTDANGSSVASGIYFYKVTAGANSATMKMVLMK